MTSMNLTPPLEHSSSRLSLVQGTLDGVETPGSNEVDLSDAVLIEELSADDQGLSEAQLRQLYDEEEVERFMYFFSAVGTLCLLYALETSQSSAVCDGSETTQTSRQCRPTSLTAPTRGHSRAPLHKSNSTTSSPRALRLLPIGTLRKREHSGVLC